MSHSFTNLMYHLIFATKNRTPWIEQRIQADLFAYLGTVVTDLGGIGFIINGMEEHVHLLVKMKPTLALSDVVRDLKARSSAWVHRHFADLQDFSWQTGFGGFTVSQSQMETVHRYIETQKEHHATMPFDLEIQSLLRKNGGEKESLFWE